MLEMFFHVFSIAYCCQHIRCFHGPGESGEFGEFIAIAIADLRHTSFQIALSAAQSHIEQVRIEQRQQDLVRLEVAMASHGISGTEWQVH